MGAQNIVLTALFTDDESYAPDRVFITFATNSPEMGTTNPAPGTYTYFDGDEYTVTAIPNPGYRLMGWTVSFIVEGQVITYPTDDAVPTITGTAYADEGYNAFTLTAIFGPDNISADSLTLVVGVDLPHRGTVTPVPGTYNYSEGEIVTVTATANSGYWLTGWHVTLSHPVYGIVEDEEIDSPIPAFSFEVERDMLGYVYSIVAKFGAPAGISDAEADNVNVYGMGGRVVVSGAEGREVHVFDLSGRCVYSSPAIVTTMIDVPSSGVYLVRVGDNPARKIVVIR